MTSQTNKPSEFTLIAKYFAPLAGEGSFGLADDAAQFTPTKGHSLVVTQDSIAEGVHFFDYDPPATIARKAVRVNLSDLAAKGATPKTISIALGLGSNWTEGWVAEFADGIAADCQEFGITVSGGDTFATNAGTVISVTAIGEVPEGQYTSRLGAKDGDLVFVTGTIGDGGFGLAARQGKLSNINEDDFAWLIDRYLLPKPRMQAANLIRQYATASMDISDGLIADAEKLGIASRLSMNIKSEKVPVSKAVERLLTDESNFLETVLSGGDDYEILFTIAPEICALVERQAKELPFALTCIGEMRAGQGVRVFDSTGHILEVASKGYDHSGTNQ